MNQQRQSPHEAPTIVGMLEWQKPARPKEAAVRALGHGDLLLEMAEVPEWLEDDTNSAMLRSESPRELRGYSGVFDSFKIDTGSLKQLKGKVSNMLEDLDEVTEKIPQSRDDAEYRRYCASADEIAQALKVPKMKYELLSGIATNTISDTRATELYRDIIAHDNGFIRYCELWNEDPGELLSTLTFSLWKYIPGTNITICNDSHVGGKYNLFYETAPGAGIHTVVHLDHAGKLMLATRPGLTLDQKQTERLTEYFRSIEGNASLVGNTHALSAELQLSPTGEIKPLQLQLGKKLCREVARPLYDEDYKESDGWFPLGQVQGVTPREGIVARLSERDVWPGRLNTLVTARDPKRNYASAMLHMATIRLESVNMAPTRESRQIFAMQPGHSSVGQITDPLFSASVSSDALGQFCKANNIRWSPASKVDAVIVSDGTRGFVRFKIPE
jgi:hypothetical protein